MEVLHHIAFNSRIRPELAEALERSGIKSVSTVTLSGTSSVVAFEIAESHPQWPWFRDRLQGIVNIARTVFTTEEILGAEWARLIPTSQRGYPHPRNSWVETRPNQRRLCAVCGADVQVAPFVVASEPRLGTSDFLSLFWTYALMARRTVVEELSGLGFSGFQAWDLIVAKTGGPSRHIQQLIVETEIPPSLLPRALPVAQCSRCGRAKYEPHRIGPMTFNRDGFVDLKVDLACTSEWFGSGGNAYHEYIISHRLAEHVLRRGYSGVSLQPIVLASSDG